MIAMDFSRRWTRPAVAALGFTALAFTAACNTAPQASSAAQPFAQAATQATNQAGTPVVVSCEPHQRTLVRPTVMNGVTVSQVECVAAEGMVATAGPSQAFAPVPASYQPVSYQPALPVTTRRVVQQPVYSDIPDAQVVPVSTQTVRPVRTNQVVYDERPVRKTRSVAKSAIIIGSSAGVGAGVGAAVGGKKGALIGAALGGGGATVWDQVTRRK
jgi:uncharacterized protein YcfJ